MNRVQRIAWRAMCAGFVLVFAGAHAAVWTDTANTTVAGRLVLSGILTVLAALLVGLAAFIETHDE